MSTLICAICGLDVSKKPDGWYHSSAQDHWAQVDWETHAKRLEASLLEAVAARDLFRRQLDERVLDAAGELDALKAKLAELAAENARVHRVNSSVMDDAAMFKAERDEARAEWQSCCERERGNFEEVKTLRAQAAALRAALAAVVKFDRELRTNVIEAGQPRERWDAIEAALATDAGKPTVEIKTVDLKLWSEPGWDRVKRTAERLADPDGWLSPEQVAALVERIIERCADEVRDDSDRADIFAIPRAALLAEVPRG